MLTRLLVVFTLMIAMLFIGGCAYFFPDTSKALTEKDQYKVMLDQNQIQERQAKALERIADALEKANKK